MYRSAFWKVKVDLGNWEMGQVDSNMYVGCIHHRFSIRALLPTMKYSAAPVDLLGCHNWVKGAPSSQWEEAKDSAEHSAIHRTTPAIRDYPAQGQAEKTCWGCIWSIDQRANPQQKWKEGPGHSGKGLGM